MKRPSRRWQDDIARKERTTWNRKATDRGQWKTLMEVYIPKWMDNAEITITSTGQSWSSPTTDLCNKQLGTNGPGQSQTRSTTYFDSEYFN